jgi:hypothetical protein
MINISLKFSKNKGEKDYYGLKFNISF